MFSWLHVQCTINILFTCLDIVSAYLHAVLIGEPRFITLWGDEQGTVRQLFKAMNGVDNAAQLWNKHFHGFMMQEGFKQTSRDDCIYTHPKSSVQASLYVDDILASSDSDKKFQLEKFIKKVQTVFSVRILGEPTNFLGMEISDMRQQGVCCVSQEAYIEKLASFLCVIGIPLLSLFPLLLWKHMSMTSFS